MLNYVCAFHFEALPLIRHYGLKKRDDFRPFSLYEGKDRRLLITGVGKIACATAIGASLKKPNEPWLNVGIIGHGKAEVGSGFLVHRCEDRSSGHVHYPVLAFSPPCLTTEIVTVSVPEVLYKSSCGYDMELSAFYEASSYFSPLELLHSYKIVSDTPSQPASRLTKDNVQALITPHLDTIEDLSGCLLDLSQSLPQDDPNLWRSLEAQYTLTFTESQQLRKGLQRWMAAKGKPWEAPSCQNGQELLQHLHHALDHLTLRLAP